MPDITVSLDNALLERSREYARRHNKTLDAVIRESLESTVREAGQPFADALFEAMDRANGDSEGISWRREDLYDI